MASTTELHEKISQLANRVRELEDALRASHSQIASDVHPLLTEDLLAIKYGPETLPASRDPTGDHHGASVGAFGTLTITDSGESNYFGQSGGVEVRFLILMKQAFQ